MTNSPVFYFAWDAMPRRDRATGVLYTNLENVDYFDRLGSKTFSLIDHCKALGSVRHVELGYVLKRPLKFIYTLGTSGGPYRWFDDANNPTPISLFDFINKHRPIIIKKMQEQRCFLHIDQGWEGDPLVNHYAKIYQALKLYNINPRQVIYSTNNLIEKELHDKYTSERQDKIQIGSSPHFASSVVKANQVYSDFTYSNQLDYKINNQPKYFNYLNRTVKESRIRFGMMMNFYNLLDSSLGDISFQKINFNTFEFNSYPAFTRENYQSFVNKLPFVLDTDTTKWNPGSCIVKEFYLHNWFSLVPETYIYEHQNQSVYMSEKIFKPIGMFSPFVLIGHPNSLAYLKKLGFKTFDKWWDESYDKILDPVKRMKTVALLVKKLVEKSYSEWLEIYKDMQNTLEHNHNHLQNNSLINYDSLNLY